MDVERPSRNSAEALALEAERRANKRIAEAHQQEMQAERQLRQRLDDIKDEFVRQSTAESVRQEAAIMTQKQKGYENLRDVQRAQKKDIQKTMDEGERALQKTSDHYRDVLHTTSQSGERELKEIKEAFARQSEHLHKISRFDAEQLQADHTRRTQELKERFDASVTELAESARKDYEQRRLNAMAVNEQAQSKFDESNRAIALKQEEAIKDIYQNVNSRIREIRQDTARKLESYSDRQSDPFYKMVDLGTELHETPEEFILTARIPSHERDHVSVSVRENGITLSGYRRNEEKLEHEDGRRQTTASFQSYTENFPINWPVESRKVSRVYDGDMLIIHIPKKRGYSEALAERGKAPEKIRVEKPRFPENLPSSRSAEPPAPGDDPKPSPKTRGGRTLT